MQLNDRRGMRTQWQMNRHFWGSVKAAAALVTMLLVGLFAWNTTVLSEQIYAEYEQRNKAEEVIMSCLYHGAAYFNGEIHLCRPANTWVKKS